MAFGHILRVGSASTRACWTWLLLGFQIIILYIPLLVPTMVLRGDIEWPYPPETSIGDELQPIFDNVIYLGILSKHVVICRSTLDYNIISDIMMSAVASVPMRVSGPLITCRS